MSNFIVILFIFLGLIFPSASFASDIELSECVEIAHCVREEWEVSSIEKPFKEIKELIEQSPRTLIVELDRDYLNAEVPSKW